jgi:hypothetical protein
MIVTVTKWENDIAVIIPQNLAVILKKTFYIPHRGDIVVKFH